MGHVESRSGERKDTYHRPHEETNHETIGYQTFDKFRKKLHGVDAYVNVVPFKQFSFVDAQKNLLDRVDKERAEEIVAKDISPKEIVDEVGTQLAVDKKVGTEAKQGVETGKFAEMKAQLEQIFRQFNVREVWVADTATDSQGEVTSPGFDTLKLGHQQSFDMTTFFVPFDEAERIKKLIRSNPINTSLDSSVAGSEVNANYRWQFVNEDKFGFNFKMGGKEFMIMYLDVEMGKADTAKSEGQELSEAEMDTYFRFLDIRNEYGDKPNNAEIKKRVIKLILEESLVVSHKIKNLLRNDKWFPTEPEVEAARDEAKRGSQSMASVN